MWRKRMRRRYGALAIVTDLTLAVVILLAIIAPLYVARRRRDRGRLDALRQHDAVAEQREKESAIDALLASSNPASPAPPVPPSSVLTLDIARRDMTCLPCQQVGHTEVLMAAPTRRRVRGRFVLGNSTAICWRIRRSGRGGETPVRCLFVPTCVIPIAISSNSGAMPK